MLTGHPKPHPVAPGQESVWSYPRPAIAQACERHLKVMFNDRVLAETRRGIRTLETSHPPTYYFPREDVDFTMLEHVSGRSSYCEWKGQATYFDVVSGTHRAAGAAWSYPSPSPTFVMLAHHLAFYPALMQACYVDGELVQPQPGSFYGGWVTSHVAGPFKGEPGTAGW